ncbi:ubiquitin-conjugating enzyme/RWD-like protein [Leucosporidium creatinivorum]|uniref:Ubiquitin-conjugating enzyme/RWD-like protein n=1 Tax=Leucosporidium creatinivorum TaxID=106004 RepID=A0A1Y2F3F6_9BASI|nr:ubiquitin-conjugating enzyme/RWD-like protein [Leucosporidium creatinivorum]
MATPASSRTVRSAGVRRLLQEAAELEADDCRDYQAAPLEDDLFQWHFTIRGPGAEFEGGVYHGRMVLPSEYPFKPPEIYMATPSGRFEINKKICLSISSFHPETWQPSWGIRTALLALTAFFTTDVRSPSPVGSMDAPVMERQRLAKA